jgi:hypothetical protein
MKLNRGRQYELERAVHKALKDYNASSWNIMHGDEEVAEGTGA